MILFKEVFIVIKNNKGGAVIFSYLSPTYAGSDVLRKKKLESLLY